MTYLRLIRLLGDRMAGILMRLPFKDRWGFNLGEDLDHWASFKELTYMDRIQAMHAERFTPVEVLTSPPCDPRKGFHVGTNIHITWPEPGGSCNKCATITTTTGAA